MSEQYDMEINDYIKGCVFGRTQKIALSTLPHRFHDELLRMIGSSPDYPEYNGQNIITDYKMYIDTLFSLMETRIQNAIQTSSIPPRLHSTLFEILDKANTAWDMTYLPAEISDIRGDPY